MLIKTQKVIYLRQNAILKHLSIPKLYLHHDVQNEKEENVTLIYDGLMSI